MKQAKRILAVVVMMAALSVASTGCMVGKNGQGVVYALDTGLVVGGGAMAIAGAQADCTPEPSGDPLGDMLFGPPAIAACETGRAGMVGGGLALAAVGVLGAVITAVAADDGPTEQQPDGTDPGAMAAQAALERVDCEPHVQAYRAERSSRERVWMLGEMPAECRDRARAAVAAAR